MDETGPLKMAQSYIASELGFIYQIVLVPINSGTICNYILIVITFKGFKIYNILQSRDFSSLSNIKQ